MTTLRNVVTAVLEDENGRDREIISETLEKETAEVYKKNSVVGGREEELIPFLEKWGRLIAKYFIFSDIFTIFL